MRALLIRPAKSIRGQINLPGDKSISHRAVILSALVKGKTQINDFLFSKDCLSTIQAFKKLGIRIVASRHKDKITVFGKGLFALQKPRGPIYLGESGTTLRLLLGVLAGQNFPCRLESAGSLSRRPMRRVTLPLRLMGAKIQSRTIDSEEYSPLIIKGGTLKPISYKMPLASAQVKSAILLAGLYPKGITKVTEPFLSRDHTERMLKLFGADLKIKGLEYSISGIRNLKSPGKIKIPADISSASFFMVAASILPNSHLVIKSLGLNPTRRGIIKALKRMGADIKIKNPWPASQKYSQGRQKSKIKNFEPRGDVIVRSAKLKGMRINKSQIPSLIDELPVMMVAAALAKGKTVIMGISELHLKETDRIKSMVTNLTRMGAKIRITKIKRNEVMTIEGVDSLKGAKLKSFGDHRTAMSIIIAGLAAQSESRLDDINCIAKSFPDFLSVLAKIKH